MICILVLFFCKFLFCIVEKTYTDIFTLHSHRTCLWPIYKCSFPTFCIHKTYINKTKNKDKPKTKILNIGCIEMPRVLLIAKSNVDKLN